MSTSSQKMTLLEAFKRGETLTARTAASKYRIDTFSQRVKDIERMGYAVNRVWMTPPAGAKYMQYFILHDQFKVAA